MFLNSRRGCKNKIIVIFYLIFTLLSLQISAQVFTSIKVGAQQANIYLPLLKNKRVGLVVNQTSLLKNAQGKTVHLVDYLLDQGINIKYIFAPEHGFRGKHDAGAKFDNNIDAETGIPVVSIYGKSRKPPKKIMTQLDIIIFDIQDVGVRYYTFISSMHYMMVAAAKSGVSFMVLDRPNPNIAFVDGPLLESPFRSFVGVDKIPLLYGMTIGELALMIKGEGWLHSKKALHLMVIPLVNYTRKSSYVLPIKPSPNLPNQTAVYLYPSLAFFEATFVSVGRGTLFPFQVFGNDKVRLGHFTFIPISTPGAAIKPKLMNKLLYGKDLRASINKPQGLNLNYFFSSYQKFKRSGIQFIKYPHFLDKLAGTNKFRLALQAGKSLKEIKQRWSKGLISFKQQRKPYLIYR